MNESRGNDLPTIFEYFNGKMYILWKFYVAKTWWVKNGNYHVSGIYTFF